MNTPDLFEELELTTELTKAERARTLAKEKALGPGPIYQGVTKQLRRLTATGKAYADVEPIVDADEYAGVIALCRQLARSVDTFTGHNETGWKANGRDLAPLVEQLRLALESMRPEAAERDEFQEFLNDLDGLPTTPPPAKVEP